jgi:hypothetical protein
MVDLHVNMHIVMENLQMTPQYATVVDLVWIAMCVLIVYLDTVDLHAKHPFVTVNLQMTQQMFAVGVELVWLRMCALLA